jgi:hypothetical protein
MIGGATSTEGHTCEIHPSGWRRGRKMNSAKHLVPVICMMERATQWMGVPATSSDMVVVWKGWATRECGPT